jgi:hypothetical protein
MIEVNQTWELRKGRATCKLRRGHLQRVRVLTVSATGQTITISGVTALGVRAIERPRFLLLYRLLAHIGEPPQSAVPSSRGRSQRTLAFRIHKRREPPARTSTTS